MKRIDIFYEGREYSIGNRSVEDVQGQIDLAAQTGEASWMKVNASHGQYRQALLHITRYTHIALIAVDDHEEAATLDESLAGDGSSALDEGQAGA